MADQVDLGIVPITVFEIMPRDLGALDHIVHERGQFGLGHVHRVPPVIAKGVDRHLRVGAGAEIIAQFFDQFLVGDLVYLVGFDHRRLDRLEMNVVGVHLGAVEIFAQHRPNRLGRQRVLVSQIRGGDAGHENNWMR